MQRSILTVVLGCLALVGGRVAAQTVPGPGPATSVVLSARLESPRVVPGTQHAHLLVQLRAATATDAQGSRPLNLALVVDRSGSMQGTKIEDARRAALQMVDRMRDGDRVAIVSYDHEVRVDVPSVVLDDQSRSALRRAILGIAVGGSTNLGGGLVAGIAQVREHLNSKAVNRVLLISDGLANVGVQEPAALNQIGREALQQGVVTTTIGLGLDYNEDLMTALANHGGGNYYFVAESDRIASTLDDEVRQMASTVAQGGALRLRLPEGVTMDRVAGWVPQSNGREVTVPLGDMFAGQMRAVLWRLKLPDQLEVGTQLDLGAMEFTYETSAGPQVLRSGALSIRVTADPAEVASARDDEVTARIAEIELAMKIDEAAQLVGAHRFEQAKELLTAAAADAKKVGEKLPAAVASDLVRRAEEAATMANDVDSARTSGMERSRFMKEGKGRAYAIEKK